MDDTAAPEISASIVQRAPARAGRTSITTSSQPITPEIEPPGAIPPPRNALFDMRGNKKKQADLQLRTAFRDDLDHAPQGSVPETEVAPTG